MLQTLLNVRCLVLILFFAAFGAAQKPWDGIIPLVTNKNEIERKFGEPGPNGFYEFDEGRVFIKYVQTQCEKIKRCDCLVPIGTVQFVRVEIYYDLYLKELDLDPKEFKKTRNTHQPELFTYANHKTGVVYSAYKGKVSHITYYESKDTCEKLERTAKSFQGLCLDTFLALRH